MQAHRILLTGANGFVGSHVLSQLLDRGISVRAVVRSESKASAVAENFPNHANTPWLDFAVVPDITVPHAFDSALKPQYRAFDTVIHTASPFLYRAVNSNLDFLNPAVQGTIQLLKSVMNVAPEVRRVIITSSFAAVADLGNMDGIGAKVHTSEDWNPVTWEQALDESNRNVAYQASKKFAEAAAWKFVKEEKVNFDLVTLCPPMVYGPIQHKLKNLKDLNESNGRIYNLFMSGKEDAELPPNALYLYTDPRDLAFAHVQAVKIPEAGSKRYIVCTDQISSQEISDILRRNFPELASRVPKGNPGAYSLPAKTFSADSTSARHMLGIEFRSKEDTFVALATQLLEIERNA
ncbi:MAG: methylglyoxal reductase (NADPH-dependent) gre2 [Bathelium mastoideum]|nr:MAG: methylglyoxal reductase (NADPH-dependent) gre2 [Bathelium mastoideum]KAI9683980.1 MAG: methylglyoxal reductase (NADPH-dependent) gre2 [Bathelium mastoideum]